MILIDTNYFVDIFIEPKNGAMEERRNQVLSLFTMIEKGEVQALVSEIVIHECFYVLTVRLGLYSPVELVKAFRSILSYPGWSITTEEIMILARGLDILESNPKLEFSDAVIAARAEAHSADLATFDRRLAKAYGGPIWADS